MVTGTDTCHHDGAPISTTPVGRGWPVMQLVTAGWWAHQNSERAKFVASRVIAGQRRGWAHPG